MAETIGRTSRPSPVSASFRKRAPLAAHSWRPESAAPRVRDIPDFRLYGSTNTCQAPPFDSSGSWPNMPENCARRFPCFLILRWTRPGCCCFPHCIGDKLKASPLDSSLLPFAEAPDRIVVTNPEGRFRILAATRERWNRCRWSREVQARHRDCGPVPARSPTPDPCCPWPDPDR